MKARVKALLWKMKDDPAYAIARVIEQPELGKMGGFPDAAFLVEMKPGAEPGYALTGSLELAAPGTGTHGYLPDRPEMRASFFVMDHNIAAGRDLGLIDMRQIAPTVASLLGATMEYTRWQSAPPAVRARKSSYEAEIARCHGLDPAEGGQLLERNDAVWPNILFSLTVL